MMYDVLGLAQLGADLETDGFLGYLSSNSNDSNMCGSNESHNC